MNTHRVGITALTAICLLGLGNAQQVTEFNGLIEPHRIINVGSPQIGLLRSVDVDRGDVVKAGQVVATLDSEVERAQMEVARYRAQMEAQVRASELNKDLSLRKRERSSRMFKEALIPFSDLDDAETAMLLAEQQLMDAKENKKLAELDYQRAAATVERMTIRSPVDGVVVERFLHPGEHIETEPILKIAQIDPLNVEMILPKALFLTIKTGMRAQVIPEAPVGGRYTAFVKIVDKVIDGASGTFGVRLELPNPDNKLPAGLKCRVVFP